MPSDRQLTTLQALVGHEFAEDDLLRLALRHRSAGSPDNERLEFLGDAILDAVVSEFLFMTYTDAKEGELTTARAQLVRGDTLAKLASHWQLQTMLELGKGERNSGAIRDSILGAAVEAVIGAVYLDGGYAASKAIVLSLLREELSRITPGERQKDAKTRLQELTQRFMQVLPQYEVVETSGPAHQRSFRVSCEVKGVADATEGEATSRREAEQLAAMQMLDQIENEDADRGARD